MNKKLLQEYKLNYTLDNIPESLTEDQKIIYGYLHEGFNDSNSSKCREDATNFISGREASEGKHGYDVDDENIEIKPKNYVGKSKLNCGGQFTDFTWARHKKYQNDKVVMSVSGFNHGKLVYVLEFDYNHPTFKKRIEEQLTRLLPNGDEPNRYVRSASFSYVHFLDADIKKVYVSPNLDLHEHTMIKKLYNFLKN
jgi:hypothetical protein|tara:strand:- start:512 stop:1099 length:588 start_codon:yes stop_codon:yes gene_type:complete